MKRSSVCILLSHIVVYEREAERRQSVKEHTAGFSMKSPARALQLPDDYQKGRTFVSMEGREHVCIENFRGICSYTTEEVRLLTRRNKMCICGKRLQIDCYTKDEIEISGFIKKIEFE